MKEQQKESLRTKEMLERINQLTKLNLNKAIFDYLVRTEKAKDKLWQKPLTSSTNSSK
jgi:hypothetical protein